MNSQKSPYDNLENTQDNDMDTDMDKKGLSERAPVSAGTRSMTARDEVMRAPPGPSSSKERYRARSRSGSVSSASLRASGASTALAAERKSRRELAQENNRRALARDRERGTEGPVSVNAAESESTAEEEMGSPAREDASRKRKLTPGDTMDLSEESRSKQGRSRAEGESKTAGLYIGRAKALEEYNKKKREAAALDSEQILRNMTADFYKNRIGPGGGNRGNGQRSLGRRRPPGKTMYGGSIQSRTM